MGAMHAWILPAAILLAAGTARAAKLTTPTEEYPTLQSAVDAAAEGDVISVKPGLPTGGVYIEGRRKLKIVGSRGAYVDGAGDASYVIHIVGCEDIRIQSLEISDGTQQGIRISESTRVRVTKCTIRSNGSYGVKIRAGSTDVRIDRCTFHHNNSLSVYVTSSGTPGDPTSGVRVSGNAMEGTGVRFDSPDVIVEKNRILGVTGPHGVYSPSGDANGGIVSGNRIAFAGENTGSGISVSGSGARVERNSISGAGWFGIEANGIEVVILGNTTTGGGARGIQVNADGATVTRNKVFDAADLAFVVNANNGTWTRNASHDCGGVGFQVLGTGNTLGKNASNGAGSVGFQVWSPGNIFEKNTAKDSGEYGLVDSTGTGGNAYEDNRFGTQDIHSGG